MAYLNTQNPSSLVSRAWWFERKSISCFGGKCFVDLCGCTSSFPVALRRTVWIEVGSQLGVGMPPLEVWAEYGSQVAVLSYIELLVSLGNMRSTEEAKILSRQKGIEEALLLTRVEKGKPSNNESFFSVIYDSRLTQYSSTHHLFSACKFVLPVIGVMFAVVLRSKISELDITSQLIWEPACLIYEIGCGQDTN